MELMVNESRSKLFRFFVQGLRNIYWGEKALVRALPKMAAGASASALRYTLDGHKRESLIHADRIEKVFLIMGKERVTKKCEIMAGLIGEAFSLIEDITPGPMRDAGIIATGQKIEHYEIATYGALKSFAQILGLSEAVALLSQTLVEEKRADELLTALAVSSINQAAAHELIGR